MQLGRLGEPGSEIPVAYTPGGVLDLRSVLPDLTGVHLGRRSLGAVRRAVEGGDLPLVSKAVGMRVGPAVSRPGAVVCVGLNYAAHAAESGVSPPDSPVVFLKSPNTLAGPYDPLTLPRRSTRTDWEVELGVVIGTRALYLPDPTAAPQHIAGYVVANDLSERTFQLDESGGQWSKGKCAPGFSPIGPRLVTADAVDTTSLRLRSWVNGAPRQDSSTRDMVFDVAYLVWHLSQYMALDPGDVVLTGTPEGVALSGRFPYLQPGDVVEVEVEGLGRQRQVVLPA